MESGPEKMLMKGFRTLENDLPTCIKQTSATIKWSRKLKSKSGNLLRWLLHFFYFSVIHSAHAFVAGGISSAMLCNIGGRFFNFSAA